MARQFLAGYFLPPPLLVGSRNSLLYVSTSFIGAQMPSVRPENSPHHPKNLDAFITNSPASEKSTVG
jgi:hypothetical protein